MSGDIQNHAEKLKALLRKVDYPERLTFDQIHDQNPTVFLKILHFVLIDYSPDFYKGLLEKNYELYSKNDLRFVEQVFKLCTKELNYKPALVISQFLSETFLEHKIIFTNDVISEVLKRAHATRSKKKTQKLPPENKENEPTLNTHNQVRVLSHLASDRTRATHQQHNKSVQYQSTSHFLNDSDEDEEEILEQPTRRPQPHQLQSVSKYLADQEQQDTPPFEGQRQAEQHQKYMPNASERPPPSSQNGSAKEMSSFRQCIQEPSPQQYQQFGNNQFQCQQVENPLNQYQSQIQQLQGPPPFQGGSLAQQPQRPPQTQAAIQPAATSSCPQPQPAKPEPEDRVTHQDLQKLMQVILMNNENTRSMMQKFTELQQTVTFALNNFSQRLTVVEQQLKLK